MDEFELVIEDYLKDSENFSIKSKLHDLKTAVTGTTKSVKGAAAELKADSKKRAAEDAINQAVRDKKGTKVIEEGTGKVKKVISDTGMKYRDTTKKAYTKAEVDAAASQAAAKASSETANKSIKELVKQQASGAVHGTGMALAKAVDKVGDAANTAKHVTKAALTGGDKAAAAAKAAVENDGLGTVASAIASHPGAATAGIAGLALLGGAAAIRAAKKRKEAKKKKEAEQSYSESFDSLLVEKAILYSEGNR